MSQASKRPAPRADAATNVAAAQILREQGYRLVDGRWIAPPACVVDREVGGRVVRDAWTAWAQQQPHPKPSWLLPYDALSEADREADRQIYAACVKHAAGAATGVTIDLDAEDWRAIQQAAKGSNWVPPQYSRGDWVSDVCAFLRDGPMSFVPETLRTSVDEELALIARAAELGVQVPISIGPGRDQRQAVVHAWCIAAFGDDHAKSIEQRAVRLVEEAVEAAQAAGAQASMLHHLVDYVFSRPVGDLRQELGGVGVTLIALAAAAQLSADALEAEEVARILGKPLAHFAQRNAAKNAAGFDVLHRADAALEGLAP